MSHFFVAGDERVELPSAVLETAVLAIKLIPYALQQRSELYREKSNLSTRNIIEASGYKVMRSID